MPEHPELSMRDTKATILHEYEQALETIKALKSKRFDPAEIKKREADTAAIQATDALVWDLGDTFVEIRTKIDSHLRDVQDTLETEKETLDQVRRAKTVLEAELKSLYGISAEAETFAALIEAQQERKARFEADLAVQKQQIEDEYLAHRQTIKNEAKEAEETRLRQEKEWDYDFARRCQAKTDKINDDLAVKMKEHNTLIESEYKTLKERKEAIVKQEAEIEALRNRVDNIPAEIDLAVADAKKRLDTSHAIEIGALKRNHEADQKILAHEVKALSETNKRLSDMVESLETKLEHAYDKIQGVATQALDAQGHARTTAEVQKAVQSAAPSGKR